MSSLPKYLKLAAYIRNWPVYFKRLHKKNKTSRYVTRHGGLVLDVPPAFYEVFREVFMEDFYDAANLAKLLPSKPVIVDIGGNVGYFSFLLASLLPDSRILAFEPMTENAAVFNANLELNSAMKARVAVYQQAVTGNYNGSQTIFFDDRSNNSVVASLLDDFSTLNTSHRTIEAISFEGLLARHEVQRIDLLKMDCEGSEYAILYESPDAVFEKIGMLVIETHDMDARTRNTHALTTFLTEKGFSVTTELRENHCYYMKAVNAKSIA